MIMKAPHTYTGEDTVENRLSWRYSGSKKGIGNCRQIWGKTGRTGRIYEKGFFKR